MTDQPRTFNEAIAHFPTPIVWFSSFGVPNGHTEAWFEDCSESPWSEVEGSLGEDGRWEWNGLGDPTDYNGNTVFSLVVYNDPLLWHAERLLYHQWKPTSRPSNRGLALQVEGAVSRLTGKRYKVDFTKLSISELHELQRLLRDVDDEMMVVKNRARLGLP